VLLWNARTGRLVRRIVVSDQQQASVQFSADGRRIVTAGVDGVVHVSELRPDSVVATLRGHHGQVRAAFVPGGHGTIVSAGEEDGTLRTWLASPARVASQPGSDPTFDATGRSVLSIDRDGAVRVWEPAGGRERSLPGADASVARFSPDGAQVVSGSFHGGVRLWNLRTGRTSSVQALAGAKYAVALAPGSGRIAIGGDSPLVVQAPDGTHRVRLQGHIGRVNALAFSPDGRYVLSGSDDGIARIWDAAGGRLVRALNGHQGVVRGVAYSKDARRIATAGSDGTVAIWSVRGGDPVILAGHEGAVNTVRFDDDGSRVVTAGDDGTIRVWDPAGGDALVVLDQYAGIATGADFGRDGRDVVSAGDDGMRLSPCEVCGTLADIARLARSRAHHTLTALERRRLLPGG
jgi:WD40 repeat protein